MNIESANTAADINLGDELLGKFTNLLADKFPYGACYKELKEYAVEIKEHPVLDNLNVNISKIQGYRDRVCKMVLDAIRNTRKWQRMYEILFDREIASCPPTP